MDRKEAEKLFLPLVAVMIGVVAFMYMRFPEEILLSFTFLLTAWSLSLALKFLPYPVYCKWFCILFAVFWFFCFNYYFTIMCERAHL